MNSKIIIQRAVTNGIVTYGYNDLTDVYANSLSGDTVIVYGGTYALAADGIQLKDGVNWQFIGNPTISSDAVAGTFYDNNVAVDVNFQGELTITNSNDGASRVILQDSTSRIRGLEFVFEGIINLLVASPYISVDKVLKNSIGEYLGVGFVSGAEIRYLTFTTDSISVADDSIVTSSLSRYIEDGDGRVVLLDGSNALVPNVSMTQSNINIKLHKTDSASNYALATNDLKCHLSIKRSF